AVCTALPNGSKMAAMSSGTSSWCRQMLVIGSAMYSANAPGRFTPTPLVWAQRWRRPARQFRQRPQTTWPSPLTRLPGKKSITLAPVATILPTNSWPIGMGTDITLATDRCHIMEDPWGDHAIAVKFDRIAESVDALRGMRFEGIAAVGDQPAVLAAEAAEALGVPFHPPTAARACNDKYIARALYQAAGMRVPRFFLTSSADDPELLAARAPYPCVLK